MTNLHRIRLQGPWQVATLDPDGNRADFKEVKLPASWRTLFGGFAGAVVFQRTFNTPSNLTNEDRVYIRIPLNAGTIQQCSLNNRLVALETDDPNLFDVTDALGGFIHLEVIIACNPAHFPVEQGGLWDPVVLEIHAPGVEDS